MEKFIKLHDLNGKISNHSLTANKIKVEIQEESQILEKN